MIRYTDVRVRCCGTTILNGIDLALPDRGTVVILGPSGCGKSTLMRATIREEEEDRTLEVSGKIELRGVDIRSPALPLTVVRQKIGLVPQRPVPFPYSTLENVTLALRCTTRLSKEEIERRAKRALEEVGLDAEHYAKPARYLSGGQLKRLAIARAVALEPDALLLDEPSNGLDPLAVVRLEQQIVRLAEHRAVVVVTHDLHLARRIADEVFFLWPFFDGSRLVESGPPEHVLGAPQRAETRLFVQAAWQGAAALYETEEEQTDPSNDD